MCNLVTHLALVNFLCIASGSLSAAEKPTNVPAGYKLLYEQSFETPAALKDFVFTDAKAWKFAKDDKGGSLELATQSQYQPAVRSPFNIALVADKLFSDFVVEVDLIQTGEEYG